MSITTIRIYITRIKIFLKSLFTRIGSEKTYSEAFIGKSDKPSIFLIIIFKVKLSATKVLASQSQQIENITRISSHSLGCFLKQSKPVETNMIQCIYFW